VCGDDIAIWIYHFKKKDLTPFGSWDSYEKKSNDGIGHGNLPIIFFYFGKWGTLLFLSGIEGWTNFFVYIFFTHHLVYNAEAFGSNLPLIEWFQARIQRRTNQGTTEKNS